jgi:hypothetical protein
MKLIFALLCALSLTATTWSQAIPRDELVGPNNSIRDSMYDISLTFPAGWEVRDAARWGKNNQENTIFFQPIWPLESRPSLYYQPVSNTDKSATESPEAYFRRTAAAKAASRKAIIKDYQNLEDTFTFIEINGRPAFRYVASFTQGGKKYFEYFTRVMGEQMMVMFFTMGPEEELAAVQREIDQMSATLRAP